MPTMPSSIAPSGDAGNKKKRDKWNPKASNTVKLPDGSLTKPKPAWRPGGRDVGFQPLESPSAPPSIVGRPGEPFSPQSWAGSGYVATNQGVSNGGGDGGGKSGDYTGAGDYTGLAINSGLLYQHPEVIASDALQALGITNPEVIDLLTRQTGLAYAIQMIVEGASAGVLDPISSTDITNFVMAYVDDLLTPGGGDQYDPGDLIGTIMNADPSTALGSFLGVGSGTGNPDVVNEMIMSVAGALTNPYYRNAIENYLKSGTTGYYSSVAKGGEPGYYDYLKGSSQGGQYFSGNG